MYARQAKNRDLEVDAAEIRIRAERRLGELIKLQKETVGLATGAAGIGKPASAVITEYRTQPPTLAEVGIDKNLSSRAQKLAAVPEEKFEGMLGGWRERVADETERVTTNLLKLGENYRANSTGKNEWYTPANHIVSASSPFILLRALLLILRRLGELIRIQKETVGCFGGTPLLPTPRAPVTAKYQCNI